MVYCTQPSDKCANQREQCKEKSAGLKPAQVGQPFLAVCVTLLRLLRLCGGEGHAGLLDGQHVGAALFPFEQG